MKKDVCFWCSDTDVTGFAGDESYPLCTRCWQKLLKDDLTLEELKEKLDAERGNK